TTLPGRFCFSLHFKEERNGRGALVLRLRVGGRSGLLSVRVVGIGRVTPGQEGQRQDHCHTQDKPFLHGGFLLLLFSTLSVARGMTIEIVSTYWPGFARFFPKFPRFFRVCTNRICKFCTKLQYFLWINFPVKSVSSGAVRP